MAKPGPEVRPFQLAAAPAYAVNIRFSQEVYRALQNAAGEGKQLSLQISPGCQAGASEAVLAIGEEHHVFTCSNQHHMDLLQLPDMQHQAEVLATIQQKLQQKRSLDAGISGRVRAAGEEAARKKQEGAAVRLASQQNVKSRAGPRVTKTVQRQVTPPPPAASTPAPAVTNYPTSRTPPPASAAPGQQPPTQSAGPAATPAGTASAAPARKVLQPPKPGSIKPSSGGAAKPAPAAAGTSGSRTPQGSASPQAEPSLPAAAAPSSGGALMANGGSAAGAGGSGGSAPPVPVVLELPNAAIVAARQGELQLTLVALLWNQPRGMSHQMLMKQVDAAYKAAKRPAEAKEYVKRMVEATTERVPPNRIQLKQEVMDRESPRLNALLAKGGASASAATGSSGRDRSGSGLHKSGLSGPAAAPSPDDGSLASGQPSPAGATPPRQPAGATPPRQSAGPTPPRQPEAPASRGGTSIEAGKQQQQVKKRKLGALDASAAGASPAANGHGASPAAKKAKPAQAGAAAAKATPSGQPADRAPAKDKPAAAAVVKAAASKPVDVPASLKGISSWDDDDDSDDGALAHIPRKPHAAAAPVPPPPQIHKSAPTSQHASPHVPAYEHHHQSYDRPRAHDIVLAGSGSDDEEGELPVLPRSTMPTPPAGMVLAPPPPPINMSFGGPPPSGTMAHGAHASPLSKPAHLQRSPKAGSHTGTTNTHSKPRMQTSNGLGSGATKPSPGHAAGQKNASVPASPATHVPAAKRSPHTSLGQAGGTATVHNQPSVKRSPAATEEAAAPAAKRRLQPPSVSPAHMPRPSPLPSPAGGSTAPAPAHHAPSPSPIAPPPPAPPSNRLPPSSKPSPIISRPSPSPAATPAGASPEVYCSSKQQQEPAISEQAGSGRTTPLPTAAATPPAEEGVYSDVTIMEDSAAEAAEYAPFAAGTIPFPQLASPAGDQALVALEAQYKAHHRLYLKVKSKYTAVQAQLRALHDAAAAAAAAGDPSAAEQLTKQLWLKGASRSCQLHAWQKALQGLAAWLEAAKQVAMAASAGQQHSPLGTQTLTEEEDGAMRAAGTSTGSLALAAA